MSQITHEAARVEMPSKFATAWVICIPSYIYTGGDLLNINNSPPQNTLPEKALLTESDLHSYQAFCVDFIEEHAACALFLDCGLGKTAIALTAINRMMFDSFEVNRVLIIAPLRVARDTWPAELEKWAHLKNLHIERIIGTPKERVAALSRKAELCVVNRENVEWLVKHYAGRRLPFDMLVIDELSSFKNSKAKRFIALKRVIGQFSRVVGLTGTPAPNGLEDLWPQIFLLDRGVRLGRTMRSYIDMFFTTPNSWLPYKHELKPGAEEDIYKRLGDICVSMRATDHLQMPERVDNVVELTLSTKEEKLYKQMERDMLLPYADGDVLAINAATLAGKLLQLSNGAVYDEFHNIRVIHDKKLDALEDIIEAANGKPVLVMYLYKHDLARIQERFGKWSPDNEAGARELKTAQDMADWNDGKISIAVTQPASTGHLIRKFLKAGYMENWKYNATYSGTPQGGILSPILANIYLHELDLFVDKTRQEFERPQLRKFTPEYDAIRIEVLNIQYKLKHATEEEKPLLLKVLKAKKQKMLTTPAKSHTDKVLKYIRYADDFIIGVNGSKEDCELLKQKLMSFVRETLNMELSAEKTLITHSNTHARFLGYDIRVRRSNVVKRKPGSSIKRRSLSNMTELTIPLDDKIRSFMFRKHVVEQHGSKLEPVKRDGLIRLPDLEIISCYNAELRGICNYYGMASNFNKLNYFAYIMEYSCLKTYARKYKCHISDVVEKFKDGNGKWRILYETKAGEKAMYFADYTKSKNAKSCLDIYPNTLQYSMSTTSFESRLKAKMCELCGSTTSSHYEIHHVNKVKNLSGKADWERIMIAKRRKTMVVCRECHHKIHAQ